MEIGDAQLAGQLLGGGAPVGMLDFDKKVRCGCGPGRLDAQHAHHDLDSAGAGAPRRQRKQVLQPCCSPQHNAAPHGPSWLEPLQTAVHTALEMGDEECAELLLQHGADPSQGCKVGGRPSARAAASWGTQKGSPGGEGCC